LHNLIYCSSEADFDFRLRPSHPAARGVGRPQGGQFGRQKINIGEDEIRPCLFLASETIMRPPTRVTSLFYYITTSPAFLAIALINFQKIIMPTFIALRIYKIVKRGAAIFERYFQNTRDTTKQFFCFGRF